MLHPESIWTDLLIYKTTHDSRPNSRPDTKRNMKKIFRLRALYLKFPLKVFQTVVPSPSIKL